VHPLLAFADELERRDAEAAHALVAVESLQSEVGELRTHGRAAAVFLAALPATRDARARDEQAALAACADAERALRDAEAAVGGANGNDDRRTAERAVEQARADLEAASRAVAEVREARARLERETGERRAESARIAARAAELGPSVHAVPPSGPGLEAAVDWASRARGALLLERAALAREREQIVREANELLGSALGEPLVATAVTGLHAKLERALQQA